MPSTAKSLLAAAIVAGLIWALLDESDDARQMSEAGLRHSREAAVLLARRGDTEKALKQLDKLRKIAPNDEALLWDYMAVLSWDGQHNKVARLRRKNDMSRAPDWLLGMLTSMDASATPVASEAGVAAVPVSPADAESVLIESASAGNGKDQTETETDAATAAAATVEPIAEASPPPATTALTAPGKPARPTPASRPRAIEPSASSTTGIAPKAAPPTAAITPVSAVAQAPLAPQPPTALPIDAAEPLDPAARASELADLAVAAMRLARAEPGSDARREQADEAMARACDFAQQQQVPEAQSRCNRDRMIWWSQSGRDQQAIAAYQQLLAGNEPLTAYVHEEAVALYRRQRRFGDASAALSQLESARGSPDHALRGALLLDQNRLAEAEAGFMAAASQLPIAEADGSVSGERLALEKQAVNSAAWRGQLDRAQHHSQELVARAPEDIDARLQLAQIYRWQGWPRRAESQRGLIEQQAPNHGALLRAQIHAATDEGRFADAELHLQRYQRLYPDDPATPAMRDKLDTAAGTRFVAEWRRSDTEGKAIRLATNGSTHSQTVYSPAWKQFDDTRLFVQRQHSHAEFAGERGSIQRRGVGLMTEHRDWGLVLGWHEQVNASLASGMTLSGHLELSDHWGLDLDLQQDSSRTPIRAAINDIEADSTGMAVRHHRHDGHSYRAMVTRTVFTDDNNRMELDLSGSQPLYRDAPHRLLLREYIGFMSNSETNTPYFSPESASAAQLQLDYTGRLRAWPGDHWEHNAVAGFGVGTQSGFSAAPIWDLTYEHRYRFNRHLAATLGVQLLERVYDGNSEQTRSAFARLEWRVQ